MVYGVPHTLTDPLFSFFQGFVTQTFAEKDLDLIVKELEQRYNINSPMLEALYKYKFGKQKRFFDNYTNTLIAKSGAVLRVDHTYKIASALSALDSSTNERVCKYYYCRV